MAPSRTHAGDRPMTQTRVDRLLDPLGFTR